jgi:hypothetical protein
MQKTQMSSSYSWRPGTGKSGVMGNRALLGLRKVTAMRQLKADHPLTVQSELPSPEYVQKYRGKTMNSLGKGRNT